MAGEEEDEIYVLTSAAHRRGEPSESNANVDRSHDGLAIHAQLFGDQIVTGIAPAIFLTMDDEADQNEPMDDADALVVGDAAQPVEALKGGGEIFAAHGGHTFSRTHTKSATARARSRHR